MMKRGKLKKWNQLTLTNDPDFTPTGRPHANDDVRWMELFVLAGAVRYEEPEQPEPPSDGMDIDEFMDYVEDDLKKQGVKFISWRK